MAPITRSRGVGGVNPTISIPEGAVRGQVEEEETQETVHGGKRRRRRTLNTNNNKRVTREMSPPSAGQGGGGGGEEEMQQQPRIPHPPTTVPRLRGVAQMYLVEAEEYVDKAEGFEKEAHRSMDEADCYSKRGEDFVEKALNDPGPGAIALYESARDTYNAARRCLEESVRCNDAATRNYRNARDYYEAYGQCSVLTTTPTPTTDQTPPNRTSSPDSLLLPTTTTTTADDLTPHNDG